MGKCFLFEQPYHHSNRGCVYITGVQAEQERKLLGVPETKDGTWFLEAEVVKELLMQWRNQEGSNINGIWYQ